ncbi:hypothetical protein F3B23_11915 [Bacteroides fragilis]|uniref:Transmembrane protein n=2 Tax=Bacteroides fragilis TaxID=817 RepID=A0A5C6J7B0_BACFG|nr:hypothetical protein F3B28_14590 [Bacteroides fragilis]BAD49020.1 hypothetical protein BF2273 [Bacteroides fragilis YCH46]KAA4706661.1 hypothetical protein F3B27_16605 [Bacteroides fragilis]KAA4716455.1 hypothetical protein F3B32_15305 [Bacteroides fragilis]KAA4725994.1 hypothetical protein F3B30_15540 [Bacteroides fragilis]
MNKRVSKLFSPRSNKEYHRTFFLLIINNLKSILCYSVSSVVSFDTLIFILKMFHSQEY